MSEYTPTTYEVMNRYYSDKVNRLFPGDEDFRVYKEFDRWLAQHDAEVAEETLNKVIMLLNSELEENQPHPEEARGLTRALQIVFLLATRQGPRDET